MTTPAIMLGLLIGPLLLASLLNRLAGKEITGSRLSGRIGIALVFGFTGVGHFVKTGPMAGMLPDRVPGRIALVYVTGVVELAAAVAVLVPRLRRLTGLGLIALLILFLPVNVYAAVHHVGMGGHAWGPVYLLVRVPLQAILIGWTWWFAVRPLTMEPIRFSCRATLDLPPEEIAAGILDLDRWPEFTGYGPLPGIRSAEFELRTPQIVGSKVRVTNTDGSTHVEQIVEWAPPRRLRLHMGEFTPPLSRLASGFDEIWEFESDGDATRVVRSFEMHPRSDLTRPLLWLISRLVKRAIARHLRQMREDS
jgi:uncharacterized membrane protein